MNKNWTAKDIPNLNGKRAIVTGANSGLGFETARELARAGAEVVLACRSGERGEAALRKIAAETPGARVGISLLDTSSLASVRAFAGRELDGGKPVDILVNNAGIMALPKRELSPDGFELQMATNYLGHYALTGLLLPVLLRAPSPRVVNVSSNAHKRARLVTDDWPAAKGYSAIGNYNASKLAMLVFARELQKQSDRHGGKLLSVGAHPGAAATPIVNNSAGAVKLLVTVFFKLFSQDAEQGALPQLYAATAPDAERGGYYGPGGFQEFKGPPARAKVAPAAADPAIGPRLWVASEQATGVRYDWSSAAR